MCMRQDIKQFQIHSKCLSMHTLHILSYILSNPSQIGGVLGGDYGERDVDRGSLLLFEGREKA